MRLLLVMLAACAQAAPPPAPPPHGAVLGETLTIDSKILGERRVINVYLPPDYAKGGTFPVLYMPDGGMAEDFPHIAGSVDVSIRNEVIVPMLVVGIENTERRRDLVDVTDIPEEQKAAPHAGGSAKFRRFLREEVKPLIARKYHVTATSAIIGESLAGLFVLETLLEDPTLFDAYISVDPSVWWNDAALVRSANDHLNWWTAGPKQLYIATADYKDTQDAVAELIVALRLDAPPIAWIYDPLPEEHHNTIYALAAVRGIRALFPFSAI